MFLTEEDVEFMRKREQEKLAAASRPDQVSEPLVCTGDDLDLVHNSLACIGLDENSDDLEPSEKFLQQTNDTLYIFTGYNGDILPPKSLAAVKTVDKGVVLRYDTPIGYVLPKLAVTGQYDWNYQFMDYPETREMLIKMAKRCIRQIMNSRGYDLDVLPPQCMYCPLVPDLWFKKSKRMYAEVEKATQFVIKTRLNKDKSHKPYELVDIKKVVGTCCSWHVLLTFTVKEVDADTDDGDDDKPFDYGVIDKQIYGVYDHDLPDPYKIDIDYDNDDDNLFNYCSNSDGDCDGDGAGALKTYQATVYAPPLDKIISSNYELRYEILEALEKPIYSPGS